jgi:hypothetical protein
MFPSQIGYQIVRVYSARLNTDKPGSIRDQENTIFAAASYLLLLLLFFSDADALYVTVSKQFFSTTLFTALKQAEL